MDLRLGDESKRDGHYISKLQGMMDNKREDRLRFKKMQVRLN